MSKKNKKRYLTLSLSMIVKNEEKFLEGCLESVKGIVDEIVIIDTGSTDRTKEIAERCGARVFDFGWTGDFAEARNFSLKQCTGGWILYLDADERITEGHGAALRQLLSNKNVGAYNLMLESDHSFQHGTVRQSNAYPRLFRKLPGIQFEGKVHEQVLPSLQRLNLAVIPSSVKIIHLGYAQGFEVLKQKAERNIELLQKQLAENPNDAYARFQLGNTLVVLHRFDEARPELDNAIANPKLPGSSRAASYNLLAEVEVKRGNLPGAAEYCRKSLEIAPNQLMAHWFLALIFCDMKNFAGAVAVLEKLEQLFDVPAANRSQLIASDLDLKKEEALLRFAFCYEQIGEYRKGAEKYAQTLELMPNSDEAVNGFLRCIERINDPELAIEKLVSLTKKNPKRTEFFFPLARYYRQLNNLPSALKFIEQTMKTHPSNADAYAMAARWRVELGCTREAEEIIALAEENNLRTFELHKLGMELSLKRGDVNSAFRHLDLMTQSTNADLSPLKARLTALAARISSLSAT